MTQISTVEKTSDAGWLHFSLPDCLFSFSFMRPRRTQICSSYWSVGFSLPSFCFPGLVRRHSSRANICSKPSGWFRGYFSSVCNLLCFTWSQRSQFCTFTEIRTFPWQKRLDRGLSSQLHLQMSFEGRALNVTCKLMPRLLTFPHPLIRLIFCFCSVRKVPLLLAGLERKRQSTSTFAYIIPLMSDRPLQRSKFLAES